MSSDRRFLCVSVEIFIMWIWRKDGSKQGGVRPALVVSNNKANKHSPVVTVVPLSARVWKKKYLPTMCRFPRQWSEQAEHGTGGTGGNT